MTHQNIIQAMTTAFENFCESHPHVTKQDFYDCDLQSIAFHAVAGIEMLWVLDPYGTHLSALHLHPRGNEAALATIECARGAGHHFQCFHIANGKLYSITEGMARTATKSLIYQTRDGSVTRLADKTHLASVSLDLLDYNYNVDIRITSNGSAHLALRDLIALYRIGIHEAEAYAHSLWVKPRAFTLDGNDLYEAIVQRKQNGNTLPLAA